MNRQTIWFLPIILLVLAGCSAAEAVPPAEAQTRLSKAWAAPRRAIWQIDWPAAPVGGPVTAMVWQYGPHLRVEILEAPAPALVGQTLIVNRGTTWQFNRFDTPPATVSGLPSLPPVTDAFAVVDRLVSARPVSATRQTAATLQYNPAEKIETRYPNGDRLTFWLDPQTGLPVHLIVYAGDRRLELKAVQTAPLDSLPLDLFSPP